MVGKVEIEDKSLSHSTLQALQSVTVCSIQEVHLNTFASLTSLLILRP